MEVEKVLKRLDKLFEEAIINQDDSEVLEQIKSKPTKRFSKHLAKIKELNKQANI